MPELPEVETVRRVLVPHLRGRTITDVQIISAQVIAAPCPEKFSASVKGQTITSFVRKGKFLRLTLAGGDNLTLHLRMTGCLTIVPRETPQEKHTHLIFRLDNGDELRYEDARRFGKFWFIAKDDQDGSGMQKLGIEPFDAELSPQYLQSKYGKSKKPVKELLLDQSVVAGIGNIYSDEILFAAKIRPDKPCALLADEELESLATIVPKLLAFFIEKNTVTFEEYSLSKGRAYRNAPYLQVYGRADKPCPVCGGTLQRIAIVGRSAVFCPRCQK